MISVIIPAYNEAEGLPSVLGSIAKELSVYKEYEIIVVNDGSTDNTIDVLKRADMKNVRIINHVENLGYGRSLYDGIAASKHECILIMDGDGSYPANEIKRLKEYYPQYDMIVGARTGKEYKKGIFKNPARFMFNRLAEYACGRKIADVNSGFRIFKKSIVMPLGSSLCTGFSFTTSLTLIFFLNNHYIKYVPITYLKRVGKSKIRHFRDTLRAAQMIVEMILFYNPIKLFLLLATANAVFGILLFVLNGIFFKHAWLWLISAICVASFMPIFCLGLLNDQLKRIHDSNRIKA